MRIILTSGSPPRLEQPDDFKRFSLAVAPDLMTDLEGAVAAVAVPADDAHAWVRPDAIRAISPMAGQAEWEAGFAAMIEFASRHGWTDPKGRIRGHIETLESPDAVDADMFRQAMRCYASGVCVVAAGEGEDRRGMTVSAFSSVSADPAMVLVCLNRSSSAHRTLTEQQFFSINILSAEQEDVALCFAGLKGLRGADRFDDSWGDHRLGTPILRNAHYSIVCSSEAQHVAGTHTVLIGRVVDLARGQGRAALVNYDGAMVPSVQAA